MVSNKSKTIYFRIKAVVHGYACNETDVKYS